MGIYKFGNNTYPRRIRRRSNLGHIFWEEEKSASYGLGNTVLKIQSLSPEINNKLTFITSPQPHLSYGQ